MASQQGFVWSGSPPCKSWVKHHLLWSPTLTILFKIIIHIPGPPFLICFLNCSANKPQDLPIPYGDCLLPCSRMYASLGRRPFLCPFCFLGAEQALCDYSTSELTKGSSFPGGWLLEHGLGCHNSWSLSAHWFLPGRFILTLGFYLLANLSDLGWPQTEVIYRWKEADSEFLITSQGIALQG